MYFLYLAIHPDFNEFRGDSRIKKNHLSYLLGWRHDISRKLNIKHPRILEYLEHGIEPSAKRG